MAAKAPRQVIPLTRSGSPARTRAKIREKIYLTYPAHLIKEPVIYDLGRKFGLRTNIRGANVSDTIGLVALELDGTRAAVDRAVAWLRQLGITVEPIEKNVIE